MKMHDKLVKKGRAWAFRHYPLVVSELSASGAETADIVAFGHGYTAVIECKANRADFFVDQKKNVRRWPEQGMGDARYYLVPQGLITVQELPDGWGLLELKGERVFKTVESRLFEKKARAELSVLVSIIRRLNPEIPGVSIRFYQIQTGNRSTVISAQEGKTP